MTTAVLENLLHGDETWAWGDQTYHSPHEVKLRCPLQVRDFTNRWCKAMGAGAGDEAEKVKTRRKSEICYRGINESADWLVAACALVNLFMARRRLLLG